MTVRLLLAMLLGLAACSGEPAVHRFAGATMGSTYEVKFVGDAVAADLQRAVEAILADYDRAFSKWRDDSEIVRCNAAAADGEPFAASALFARVLGQALEIAAATDGAFDPTVEPLLRLYRAAKQNGGELDPVELAAAGARVGYRHVELRDGVVHRSKPGVELDLDGIVAGACIDDIARELGRLGVRGCYLEVTGEVYCAGEKAPGRPWVVGVVDPRSDVTGGDVPLATLPLRDRALCTSGDYRNAFASGGRIVHHIFDPRTGQSADSKVVSASVVGPDAAVADALATALIVLGEPGAARLLEREYWQRAGVGALLLVAGEDGASGPRAVELRWPGQ
ncbi:MAG: FAD:protein FMN transferase [Planctomycetes bacterium]|nr:FAD:protein FMN transferase [Planctomycetota bacterium]